MSVAVGQELRFAREPAATGWGLTDAEARDRIASVGFNEPVTLEKQALVLRVARRFANPLVAILILASIASAVLRDFANASIVLAIVVLSVVTELVQTRRSERAADALKERVAHTATVLRDKSWREIPRRLVVPDDVVRLSAGDMIPADALLVEAKDLHVNEAALTGESLPIEKNCGQAVLMGSSVVSGSAVARVTLTGSRTAFGGIAKSLAVRPPQSAFERDIVRFGLFILKTVLFLVAFVFVVTAVLRKDPLESLLFAVALAVGLTPEFLPMITTVTLTRGAVRMARSKVIVKNLAAIQNFGSIDVLACDKTGTLTTGEMTLERFTDPIGAPSTRPLLFAYLNSYFETGVDNPMDAAVLRKGKLNPLDSAVLRHDHPDISGFVKVDEVPFDFERRCVSVVAAREEETLLVTKGAPEHVMLLSTAYEVDGQVHPLDDPAKARISAAHEDLGIRGFRVLAVAYSRVSKRTSFTKDDERGLTLAGFLAFADPPRDDARDVLAELRKEGIHVKVLTGDNELVTRHVCERVGIAPSHVLLGRQIDAMSDPALAHKAERAQVFARMTPEQKNRVLRALKMRGHVVGFLGDGINDAPSLHAADVGISVASGVDVAKEAADIILLEPGLRVLLAGVLEGRRAFGNVMKYLLMGTSSNFGNMFSMAGAFLILPFLPMLPSQILLNNFLYDFSQITIPTDNVDESFIHKPRKWDISFIRQFMILVGPLSSIFDFLTFYVMLNFLGAGEKLFHSGWFVESLATQTLVLFIIRTQGNPFKSRPSLPLTISIIAIVLVGLWLPFSPLSGFLGFVPLPAGYFIFLLATTLLYLGLVEIVKRRVMGRLLR